MRACQRCGAPAPGINAKLCGACRKICPRCKENEVAPSKRLCRGCHAANMRETRPSYRDLPLEKRRAESAKQLARYYLKKGLIERGPCAEPGCDQPAQMHQLDPLSPLSIVWACKTHWRRLRQGDRRYS